MTLAGISTAKLFGFVKSVTELCIRENHIIVNNSRVWRTGFLGRTTMCLDALSSSDHESKL